MNMPQYSNKLKLLDFFNALNEEIYVVIKIWDYFPDYYQYSDIDIFCSDLKSCSNMILKVGNTYVNDGFKIKIKNTDEFHIKIDFYSPDNIEKLDFRFDLYGAIPKYKKIHIYNALFYSILENRENVLCSDCYVSVPSMVDNLLLRYIEFIEFFDQRADKIKHLEYIERKIEKSDIKEKFLDKLHLYTKPKLLPIPDNTHYDQKINESIENKIIGIKESISLLIAALKRKIKKGF